jgi:methionine sulfoxide reductase heme-binding subunit
VEAVDRVSGANPNPYDYIWWLASRASGIVALGLITASVGLGLLMASKLLRRPGLKPRLMKLHEHLALSGLVAIGVHGVTLLGDRWLNPGIAGITVPFTMAYRPLFTGLGIVSAYLAAALGLSFYARRRIGARLWRKLHRTTSIVYVLAVVHALGAGTDGSTLWLRAFMLVTGAPILFLGLVRILPRRANEVERARALRRRPAPLQAVAAAEGERP